jgi:hypothetical protein
LPRMSVGEWSRVPLSSVAVRGRESVMDSVSLRCFLVLEALRINEDTDMLPRSRRLRLDVLGLLWAAGPSLGDIAVWGVCAAASPPASGVLAPAV